MQLFKSLKKINLFQTYLATETLICHLKYNSNNYNYIQYIYMYYIILYTVQVFVYYHHATVTLTAPYITLIIFVCSEREREITVCM